MKKYKKLEKIRKEKGYTQESLAKRLGVTKQYIWDIEDGRKNLSYKLAFRISLILGVKPDDIFLEDYKSTIKK